MFRFLSPRPCPHVDRSWLLLQEIFGGYIGWELSLVGVSAATPERSLAMAFRALQMPPFAREQGWNLIELLIRNNSLNSGSLTNSEENKLPSGFTWALSQDFRDDIWINTTYIHTIFIPIYFPFPDSYLYLYKCHFFANSGPNVTNARGGFGDCLLLPLDKYESISTDIVIVAISIMGTGHCSSFIFQPFTGSGFMILGSYRKEFLGFWWKWGRWNNFECLFFIQFFLITLAWIHTSLSCCNGAFRISKQIRQMHILIKFTIEPLSDL